MQPLSQSLRLFLLGLLLSLSGTVWAQAVLVNALPAEQAGRYSQVLQEDSAALTLEQARSLFQQGLSQAGQTPILNFGIGSRPVWLRLQLHNPSETAISVQVVTGTSWIDDLQLTLLHNDQSLFQWHSGDALAGARDLVPGIGYVVQLVIPPGSSELYLRAQSTDPMVLPIEILSERNFLARDREYKFVYGLIYGFLLALIVYNSMLFIGLRERSYLYYSIYLGLFAVLNFAYSGHGFAWLWPDNPLFQEHIIVFCMLLFGCSSLIFTSSFLGLAEHAPRALRALQAMVAVVAIGIVITLLLGDRISESLLAISFNLLTTISMVALGLTTLRQRQLARGYYLIATLCGMLGTAITILTIWAALPFTGWTYGAIKVGIIIQATLLALGLSLKVRQQQIEKIQAERLAEHDPLTGLLNRRGFNQQAEILWRTCPRNQRPLTLIMLDLDHFKLINDQHGHLIGDQVLQASAQLLSHACRAGDILGRWGGEEFLFLLPDTDLEQARLFAERLRQTIAAHQLARGSEQIRFTASFGVAQRNRHLYLEELIDEVDVQLYAAKQNGRNRVACAHD